MCILKFQEFSNHNRAFTFIDRTHRTFLPSCQGEAPVEIRGPFLLGFQLLRPSQVSTAFLRS